MIRCISGKITESSPNFAADFKGIQANELTSILLKSLENLWFSDSFRGNSTY